LGQYLPVVAMAVLAAAFAAISLVMSRLLAPRRPSAAKRAPYESGILPTREPPERFPVRFYLVAMIFIVFDVEIILLFPWAVIYRNLGAFGLVEVVLFSAAVFVSFVFLISNGALDWGPLNRARRVSPMVSAERTTRTTIRRVGLEGRPETPAGAAVGAGDMSPAEEPAQPVEPAAAAGGEHEEVA
jgi:NADH-quinone oxidoreductase subunit A